MITLPTKLEVVTLTAKINKALLKALQKRKLKGGDLKDYATRQELRAALEALKVLSTQYNAPDSSVPAGGFSGANSLTMRSSRSGCAMQVDYNNVHRGGQYGFNVMYNIQVQIGGGIAYLAHNALLQVCMELLSLYTHTSSLGKSRVQETDGTNWSSIMLVAPAANNQYTPLYL